MSTRKPKSAKRAPRPKDHSPEQVKEVALMLYARRYAQDPFPPNSFLSKLQLNQLVRQANDLLDKLDVAYEEVAKQRKADAQKPPPDVVPFNKAVKVITRQQKLQRALERFDVLPHITASVVDFSGSNSPVERMKRWRKQIALWRENGMKRNEVEWWRLQYDEKAYRRWRISNPATAKKRAKKRRAPWSKKRLDKVALESSAREVKRQEKVDTARRLARGEIE